MENEVALSDGSELVAEEMEFRQGWNSPSPTRMLRVFLLGQCGLNVHTTHEFNEMNIVANYEHIFEVLN